MPFTGAHPAAIIPLVKHKFILSALIFGSIAPDLGYYVGFESPNRITHSVIGIFLFSLPVGFLSLMIFHYVLKRPLLELLPDSLRSRLFYYTKTFSGFSKGQFRLVVLSLILGAFTHIAWDTLTHEKDWVLHGFTFVKQVVLTTGRGSVQIHHLFQHGSTVVGLGLIVIWLVRWFQRTKPQNVPHAVFPLSIRYTLIFTMIAVSLLLSYPPQLNRSTLQNLSTAQTVTEFVVIKSISILFTQLIIYSIGVHMFLALNKRKLPANN
ncbi:MAG: DUF4184 family protein [Fibrobacter sp.]|nr:DUF4184 family protein [Fibrobacter sp.]